MKPYALIDLHCDTLTDCKYSSGLGTDTLDDPQRVLSLTSIPKGSIGPSSTPFLSPMNAAVRMPSAITRPIGTTSSARWTSSLTA